MKELIVSDFSSIKRATLTLNQVNLIIGPQASGKSVLCKLSHFFLGLVDDAVLSISDRETFDSFVESTKKKFTRWFPLESWGDKKFEIVLRAGDFEVKVMRTEYKEKLGQKFRIFFSEGFKSYYDDLLVRAGTTSGPGRGRTLDLPISLWDVRRVANQLKVELLGDDYFERQLFIPAGRSFFTSVGQSIVIFEQSSTLDPLTISFGRLFRTQLDTMIRGRRPLGENTALARISAELLGGHLSGGRDNEHLAIEDGRKVPLALLSSGQQELLPLLTVLPGAFLYETRQIVYIEEPEAHLFPQTQSSLVQTLVSLVAASRTRTNLILTTHSPYVLAKFNNLVKAGNIGRGKMRARVAEIIPSESWLPKGRLNAFALIDGHLESITESDGLINGDYLDDVSGQIAIEFDRLLELEATANA